MSLFPGGQIILSSSVYAPLVKMFYESPFKHEGTVHFTEFSMSLFPGGQIILSSSVYAPLVKMFYESRFEHEVTVHFP